MNDGFLDAECVIAFFISIGLIKPAKWKHNTIELFYLTKFYYSETNGTLSLQIDVYNKLHCISKSQVRLFAKKHNIDMSPVFENCSLK